MNEELTDITLPYKGFKFAILFDNSKIVQEEKCESKKWFARPVFINLVVINWVKIYFYVMIFVLSINFVEAQNRNFHTSIGLGIGPSFPIGSFKSKNNTDFNNGFASKVGTGFKFILEQNIGKYFGVSLNFYSMYYTFDFLSFEKYLNLNNSGLVPDIGMKYEIQNTESEWEVNVGNIGAYYYRNIGNRDKLLFKIIGSVTITDMNSPSMVIDIKDSSNSTIEVRTIESATTWREVFLFPPIDGFSIEINAQYFFTKHFAIRPSVNFVNSIGWFNGQKQALINL
jgi:hypothetical protein